MSFAPYFSRNFSITDFTAADLLIGLIRNSDSAPRASIRIDGLCSMFRYHCVSVPRTGSRYKVSPSLTNQTGMEIVFPDFLPTTLSLIWRWRERRSLSSSDFRDILELLFQLSVIWLRQLAKFLRMLGNSKQKASLWDCEDKKRILGL